MDTILSGTPGVRTAPGLDIPTSGDLLAVAGYRLSEKYIQNIRKSSPVSLFIDIDTDIDICRPTAYAVEKRGCSTGFSDTVLGGTVEAQTWNNNPGIKKFHGYREMTRIYKMHKDQLECIERDPLRMRAWLNDAAYGIEDAKNEILALFTNILIASGVHDKNQGNEAGMTWGGQMLGTRKNPIRFNPNNSHKAVDQILNTIKQMPSSSMPLNEFGSPRDNMYLYGHSAIESVFMNTPQYASWERIGDCAGCNMFIDVFDRKPRNIMPIASDCIPQYICKSAGKDKIVSPMLFGNRYEGVKAAIKVDTDTYKSNDGDWTYFRTRILYNMHVFDCRYHGLAWVSIENDKPELLEACQ